MIAIGEFAHLGTKPNPALGVHSGVLACVPLLVGMGDMFNNILSFCVMVGGICASKYCQLFASVCLQCVQCDVNGASTIALVKYGLKICFEGIPAKLFETNKT